MVDGVLTGVGEEVPDQGMITFERHMNRKGKGEQPLKQEAASAMLCHLPDCPHQQARGESQMRVARASAREASVARTCLRVFWLDLSFGLNFGSRS